MKWRIGDFVHRKQPYGLPVFQLEYLVDSLVVYFVRFDEFRAKVL